VTSGFSVSDLPTSPGATFGGVAATGAATTSVSAWPTTDDETEP
jgi:hypothetical protein